eukprot:6433652-Prymnesium_polylepis.1
MRANGDHAPSGFSASTLAAASRAKKRRAVATCRSVASAASALLACVSSSSVSSTAAFAATILPPLASIQSHRPHCASRRRTSASQATGSSHARRRPSSWLSNSRSA